MPKLERKTQAREKERKGKENKAAFERVLSSRDDGQRMNCLRESRTPSLLFSASRRSGSRSNEEEVATRAPCAEFSLDQASPDPSRHSAAIDFAAGCLSKSRYALLQLSDIHPCLFEAIRDDPDDGRQPCSFSFVGSLRFLHFNSPTCV